MVTQDQFKAARESLYNIDGPLASPEAMIIENSLMAIEAFISQQREAIEKVIDDLKQRKHDARLMQGSQRGTLSAEGYGRYMELKQTIDQLQEVLAYADSNTDSPNGHGSNDRRDGQADQVVSSE